MSGKERERSHVVRQWVEGLLGQREASERLGIGVRQLKRLVRHWREAGDAGLVSRRRGRAAPNRLGDATRQRVKVLLADKYPDFGATLASEKLFELDGIAVSRESVRRLQIELKLWKPKRRRARRVFQLRQRRPRFGELIQIDGSPPDWFERRGTVLPVDVPTGLTRELATARMAQWRVSGTRAHGGCASRPRCGH